MPIKCKLCHNEDTQLLFFAENTHGRESVSQDRFGLYKCNHCKAAFVDVEVNPDYYEKYYKKNYYEKQISGGLFAVIIKCLEWVSDKFHLSLIKKAGVTQGKILEIGCGQGRFLHGLPSCFDKYGIEINKEGYDHIRNNYSEIKIFNAKLSSDFIAENGKFDVIIMWHVLEHIENPDDFAEKLRKALRDNGVIVFDIPNERSLGFSWTKENWFHLDAPRHLFCYSCESIKKLFERHGFALVDYGANPFDYFQDLLASVYKKNKSSNTVFNIILLILIGPFLLILRFLCALVMPDKSEINTYILGKR
ncbi:MAG: class I SAM-dependent methyltransferase [Candidatus Omnitrophica bacterium]|nr:class I SAM-dependent methyltransferase [Candidatus Omnitrophota bacterium]